MKQSNIIRRSKWITIAEWEVQRMDFDNEWDAYETNVQIRGKYDLIFVEGKYPSDQMEKYTAYIKAAKDTSCELSGALK